jgi:hypothetical protein
MCLDETHGLEGGWFQSFSFKFLRRVNLPGPHIVDQQQTLLGCPPVSWKGANRETCSILIVTGFSEVEITSQHPTLPDFQPHLPMQHTEDAALHVDYLKLISHQGTI